MEKDINLSPIDTFARGVSYVFHPLVIGIPTLVLAMIARGSSLLQAVLWTFVTIVVGNLPMALMIVWGVRSGRYSDASVSLREQRTSIYAVGGFCLVLLVVMLMVGKAPIVALACLISAVLTTGISYLINKKTKLSLHSAAMAGCTTVFFLTLPPVGIALIFCSLLVAWARIRLKQHTPEQILIGWLVPTVCVIGVFQILK